MAAEARSRGWWIGIAALAAGLLVLGGIARSCARRPGRGEAAAMRTVHVERRDLAQAKTATGAVTPQNRVEVKPPIAGRVEDVLVREGEAVTKGQVLAWMSSAERAALLDAARAQGEEALARWESAYRPAPLTSPLDGTVIVRAVEPGQTVTTADAVVVVADRLIVKAQVDETDIGAIRVGQPATISLDAYPDTAIAARVDHVAYEAKTVNNVTIYEVDVLPQEVPEFMRSGMTANVSVLVAQERGVLALPAEALHRDGEQTFVEAPGSRGARAPVRTPVTTGITDGKWVHVVSGLEDGDAVLAPSLALPAKSGGPRRSPLAPFGRGGGGRERRNRQQ